MLNFKQKKASRSEYLEDGKLAFLLVPKCMSSEMRINLVKRGWQYSAEPTAKIIFSITREPLEKWISGMAQTFHNKPEYIREMKKDLTPFVERAWHDPHTAKQIWYYEKEGIEIFRLDQLDILKDWLHQKGYDITWPDYKTATKNPEKEKLKKYFATHLTNQQRKSLKKYYAQDYSLYQKSNRLKNNLS